MPVLLLDYWGRKLILVKSWSKRLALTKENQVQQKALPPVGIEFEIADRFVAFGLVSPEAFEGVTAEDFGGIGL